MNDGDFELPDLPASRRHSASAPNPPPTPATPAHAPRVLAIWILSSPVLLGALMALAAGRLHGFLVDAAGFGLFALAAVLTRRGFFQASREPQTRFSRRFRPSLRNLGAAVLGLATGVTAYFGAHNGLSISVAFAGVSVVGFHLLYGLEPLFQRVSARPHDRGSRAVAEALAEAEERLLNIERVAQAIGNPELRLRLGRIAEQGRGILNQIAERPSDLRRARRFLSVFLEGAERVSDGYARTHHHVQSDELEQSFRNVLVTIEDQFASQRERLRQADVLDLDVQIEVLKKQLEQEGIR